MPEVMCMAEVSVGYYHGSYRLEKGTLLLITINWSRFRRLASDIKKVKEPLRKVLSMEVNCPRLGGNVFRYISLKKYQPFEPQ